MRFYISCLTKILSFNHQKILIIKKVNLKPCSAICGRKIRFPQAAEQAALVTAQY
jgi:hypothetical protein